MKKTLAVALGMTVLSGSALATKARLIALGEDEMGSFFIEDNRNIFLNSATVNRNKNIVTFELGSEPANDTTQADTDTTPKAEGGFLVGTGSFVYGAHFGSEDNTVRQRRALGRGGASIPNLDNTLDLFFGGDAGILWGANLSYSSSTDEQGGTATDKTQDAIAARLGVISGPLEAFANVSLQNEAEEDVNNNFEGGLGVNAGVSYLFMEEYRAWANYRLSSWDYKLSGTDSEGEVSTIRLGVGRIANLNDKARLFTKVEATQRTTELGATNAAKTEIDETNLPVTVGLEVDALTWLTVRGSVSQDVILNNRESGDLETTDDNATNVNAGASLKFGDLQIDGLIGTGSGSADNNIVASDAEAGVLSTDNLMTRVSLLYKF